MKKTLVIWLIAITVLLSCTSCAAERYDLLYEVEEGDLTYCVRGQGTQAKQVVIKKGDDVVWSQKVKADRKLGNVGGTYGLVLQDLNFDGLLDMMIATDKDQDCITYVCWLRDANRNSFTQSNQLSGLCNVKADSRLQAIFAFTQTTERRGENGYATCDKAIKYLWQNGKLVPDMYAAIHYYSESVQKPYCYSVAYYDEEIKAFKDSSDQWLTKEEYEAQDWSFLYYFKEAKK